MWECKDVTGDNAGQAGKGSAREGGGRASEATDNYYVEDGERGKYWGTWGVKMKLEILPDRRKGRER